MYCRGKQIKRRVWGQWETSHWDYILYLHFGNMVHNCDSRYKTRITTIMPQYFIKSSNQITTNDFKIIHNIINVSFFSNWAYKDGKSSTPLWKYGNISHSSLARASFAVSPFPCFLVLTSSYLACMLPKPKTWHKQKIFPFIYITQKGKYVPNYKLISAFFW